MARNRILIVDDDAAIRFGLRDFLETRGYRVEEAATALAAEQAFRAAPPDAVISDYRLPDGDALQLLPRLRAIADQVPVILLTGHGSVELAVQAMKEGAEHFLTKPVTLPALLVVLERSLEHQRNRQQQLARKARQERRTVDPFLGTSAAIRTLAAEARRVAGAERPVYLRGETGTGKGVVARWLHAHGPRADEAFVDLNCAGLPRELVESELFGHERGAFTGAVQSKVGLLDLAHRGTLFLDEIGDMEPALQPKFLKVLEEQRFRRVGDVRDRQVDLQLIAATHQDLAARVTGGQFRGDLYFRISTLPLAVPALRDRVEDIPALARVLLDGLAQDIGRPAIGLAPDALAALAHYPWPGNIRELRNVLERAALLGDGTELRAADLRFEAGFGAPPAAAAPDLGGLTLKELERQQIERVLREEKGKVEPAARRLGIPRSSLYQKLKQYQIAVPRA
ncbi:MAG: sigma-54-dependent Fis family transcriptional regulator [Gemmatimonadetes bacterium]|nr:sigma-54-dependent Fis family transcriptional regulator [Gemmatimonadota bacterium]MBK7783767.1 sigma-54-dependent Fis family transcriptional regulator [Gemmatimonadota bacterium]MBK7924705.1 sigma-54-dependent Fis family transcriptional regulator [Gemmatimonadota bacterium]